MRIFDLEMDEEQVKRAVRAVIDSYENKLHEFGSYEDSVKAVQKETIENMERAVEVTTYNLTEHTGTMH